MRTVLRDGELTLRPPDERDLGAIDRGVHDPDVVLRFGVQASSAAEVLAANRALWVDGSGPTFAICSADGECIGHVWVNRSAEDRGAVGYWLLPEARGRGLATRAVRLLADWAFRDLRLAQLDLLTEADNVSSRRVAEKSGFTETDEHRSGELFDGRRVEYVVYRRTWESPP